MSTETTTPAVSPELADQPLVVVTNGDVEYTLLGTAHVSKRSVEAVKALAQQQVFDAIAVELCQSRYDALTKPDSWQKTDLFKIIRQGKAGLVAANLALGAYQRRLADQFGIEPGAEMKQALEEATTLELPHLLVDRDIGITLKRVMGAVGFFDKLGILGGLITSLVTREEISEQDIERLKEGDMLENTFAEFAENSEPLYRALIEERDHYMAAALRQQSAEKGVRKVLVVIGAGHLKGLAGALERADAEPAEVLSRLNELPRRGQWMKTLPWLITAVILTGFAIGFSRSPELGWSLVVFWVLINGTLAALGAAAARAHPLTVASGFVAAPLTSLNPTIAAGMVTASVEAYLRRPRVADFSALRDDVTTPSGWWRNRVSRVLLVFVFSNLGSMLGTWIGGFRIFGALS
ncbi:MAG: TraB/GumN family protein [Pseudomonadota bacterium]